jgi:hypothetical protein
MVPPLLLTVATIVCAGTFCPLNSETLHPYSTAGVAWRHFLVHGVQFYEKRNSISSLTRNLYLRLVGMALLEAVFSAVLVAIVMWVALSPGLTPIGNMSRDLSEVLIWGPEAITDTVRTELEIEWSVTVVQSVLFFGLFACRIEVVHEGRELVRSFLQLLRRPHPSAMLGRDTSERSSTRYAESLIGPTFTNMSASISVPTLPITEVDLSLVIQSASMLTPYGQSLDKSLPSTPGPSRPPSLVEDAPEDVVISAVAPAMIPLESPSRASAIASSHNSLESNFDPSWFVLPLDAWPRTPTSIPARLPRRSLDVEYNPEQLEDSRCDVDVPFHRATHVRSCTADFYGKLPEFGPEKRQAVFATVFKEAR